MDEPNARGRSLYNAIEKFKGSSDYDKVWDIISDRFAQQSSGVIRLVQGPATTEALLDSTWMGVEFPALLQTPSVTCFGSIPVVIP